MKHIHIIGAGGPAGVGLARCFKDDYTVTGEDGSQWARLMMEVPNGPFSEQSDMVIAPPDSLIHRNSFRPGDMYIHICADKAKTAEVLGDLCPKVLWVRDTHGAGGSGAQMAQEFLPGDNYSQEFVYFGGVIYATFQKKRVSYSVKSRTQGLENRGSSAVSICTNNTEVARIATEAIDRLRTYIYAQKQESTHSVMADLEPHGFFGVDLKCDENGKPFVTEINCGRLLTASYSYFYLTGWNLPLVGAKAYLGEEYAIPSAYPEGFGIIRQVGQEPQFFPPEVTKDW